MIGATDTALSCGEVVPAGHLEAGDGVTAASKALFEAGLVLLPYLYLPIRLFPSDQQPYYVVCWLGLIVVWHAGRLSRRDRTGIPLTGISLVTLTYVIGLAAASVLVWHIAPVKVLRRATSSVLVPLLIVHAMLIGQRLGYTREQLLRRLLWCFSPLFLVGIFEVLTVAGLFPFHAFELLHGLFVWRDVIVDRVSLLSTEPSYAVASITFLLYVRYLLIGVLGFGVIESLLFVFLAAARAVTGIALVLPVLLLRRTRAMTAALIGGVALIPFVATGMFAFYRTKISILSFAEPSALNFRWVFFLASYYAFRSAPWFGIGLGRYEDVWMQLLEQHGYKEMSRELVTVGYYQPHQHVSPLMGILADTGLVGGALFLVFLILLARRIRLPRRDLVSVALYAVLTLIGVSPLAMPYLWVLLAVVCLPSGRAPAVRADA